MTNGIKAIFEIVDRATAPIRAIGRSFHGLGDVVGRVQSSFKQFGIALKNLGAIGVKAGAVIAGGLATATAAMTAMVASTMEAAKAATLGAERTGIALKTFQGLAYAAERSGSNMDEMADAVKDFNEKIVDAVSGNKDLAAGFKSMGVSLKDARGHLRPTENILMDVADAFSRVPDGAKKSAAAMALFGDAGVQLIPMLNKGRKGIQAAADEAQRLGIILDADAAASFKRLDANMMRVRSAVQGLGYSIASKLIPTIEPLISKFTDWIMVNRDLIASRIDQWFKSLPGLISQVTDAVSRWSDALAPAAKAVGSIVRAVGPMNAAIGATVAVLGGTLIAVIAPAVKGFVLLGSAIGKLVLGPVIAMFGQLFTAIRGGMGVMAAFNAVLLANPIGATIVAVALLAGAAYLLYRNWDKVGPWFGEMWGSIKTIFGGFTDWLKGIFTGDFTLAANGVQTMMGGLWKYLSTFWSGIQTAFEAFLTFLDNTFGTNFSGAFASVKNAASDVLEWMKKEFAEGLKAAFDLAYSYVKPIIDTIKDAIAGIKSGLEWVQSFSPTQLLSSEGSAPVASASAAGKAIGSLAAPIPSPIGAAPKAGRIERRGANPMPAMSGPPGADLDRIFGAGGRAGPAGGGGGGGASGPQKLDVTGQLQIVNKSGLPVEVKARSGVLQTSDNVHAGLSNAMP